MKYFKTDGIRGVFGKNINCARIKKDEKCRKNIKLMMGEKVMKQEKTEKKQFTVFGFTIWRLMAYFIIYSILGYIVETLFGLVTKGVLESVNNLQATMQEFHVS